MSTGGKGDYDSGNTGDEDRDPPPVAERAYWCACVSMALDAGDDVCLLLSLPLPLALSQSSSLCLSLCLSLSVSVSLSLSLFLSRSLSLCVSVSLCSLVGLSPCGMALMRTASREASRGGEVREWVV